MAQGPKVVVVGAGFGGIAAAIRLAARGFSVTIVDKRDQPGGRAYTYRDAGFVFDGGPTIITAPFLLEELFTLAGKRSEDHLTLMPVDPFYQVRFHDGRTFNYTGSPERMEAEVAKFNPADVDGYRRFVIESEKIFKVGFENLGDVPFSRAFDMMKIVPQMVRLRSHLSVYSLVSRFIRDEALRVVFSFHPLLVGGNPFSTTSIYSLIAFLERKWGVWFAKGGTNAVVTALIELFQSLGGEIECGVEVDQILVENGRTIGVRLLGGRTLPAEIVVANADAPHAYKNLLDRSVRKKNTDERVDRLRYSMGLFVAYFGTKRTYPDLAHHTILLGPRYEGLLEDIFEERRLSPDFSLYLHAPTRTDPSLGPPGCETLYVLSPVPHLQSQIDWSSEAERYRDRIFQSLETTVMPGLRENLVTSRVITPQTFKDEMNSEHGAGFSIQPVLRQSAYFRFHNQSEDVDGLFFVGAGTHPGAGVPGVLCSAKIVDRLIADRDGTGNTRDPIAGTHAQRRAKVRVPVQVERP